MKAGTRSNRLVVPRPAVGLDPRAPTREMLRAAAPTHCAEGPA